MRRSPPNSDQQLDLLSPARGLSELGVPVSAATDAVPNDPLFCMWVMLARKDRRSIFVVPWPGADEAYFVSGRWEPTV